MASKKPPLVPGRLVEPFLQGEYRMPADLKIAAQRAQSQPRIISVSSRIRPALNRGSK